MDISEYSPVNVLSSLKEVLPKTPTLTVGIIAYDISEYVGKAIRNACQYADKVIVVHGRVKDFPEAPEGDVATISEISLAASEFPDKVEVVHEDKLYQDKQELQNEIANRVTTDFYMKQDADEFWKPSDVKLAISHMVREGVDILRVPFIHFWKGFDKIAKDAGGKWSAKHPRFWRWKEGFHHASSFNYFEDEEGRFVQDPDYSILVFDAICCYHCGYARPVDNVQRKLNYYKYRGIESDVEDTFTNWKVGEKTQPTQKGIRSWAEDYSGYVPEFLK